MEAVITRLKQSPLSLNLREDSILEVDFLPNQRVEVYDIHQMLRSIHKMGSGKKYKSIVHVGESTWPDTAAMKLCCSVEGSLHKIAAAFVIENTIQRVAGKLLTNLMKPQKPTKFFASKEQAENWLQGLEAN